MSVIRRALRGKCVYWPPAGKDRLGKPIPGTPVEVKCRWDEMSEMYITDQMEEKMSMAHVMVDRDVLRNGWLWNGLLADLPGGADPRTLDGAYLINKFNKIPNFKQTEFVRTAIL